MLTNKEREMICLSLDMRANWIETGIVTLSASDAIASGRPELVKPLGTDQHHLVVNLRNLARKLNRHG